MTWLWWILGALCLLTVLVLRTRVGVRAVLGQSLDVRVGWLRIRVLPAKKKKKPLKGKEPKRAKAPKAREKPPAEKKPAFTLTRADLLDALDTLPPALGRALNRTRKGLRIQPLQLWVELGGLEDPAGAAALCGRVQGLVWTGMPLAEKAVWMRDVGIHTGVNFETAETAVEGEIGAAFRVGTLLRIGWTAAGPALGWLLRKRKRDKRGTEEGGKSAA